MTPFTTLVSRAVPILENNIDTDIIIPARFLLRTDKQGLGETAFFERRYDSAGKPRPEFPLNQARFDNAQILVAGQNFGCGSSREHAVWALADLGLRCIIAPSFGEIFESNCARNGMLPLTLDGMHVANLARDADEGYLIAIDLVACTVTGGDGKAMAFSIKPDRRTALLNGWDEVAQINAQHDAEISAFEQRQKAGQPWLWRFDHA
jgi:3-isopropylmalate dehydratase small subunit